MGSTIEWGFLADLYHSQALTLVDELFIELHFTFGAEAKKALGFSLNWEHRDHSMRQQFDLLRELRRCGIAVHQCP